MSSTDSNSNSSSKLLTSLLYVLLIGLVALLGWRAINLKRERDAQKKEALENSAYSDPTLLSGSTTAADTAASGFAGAKPISELDKERSDAPVSESKLKEAENPAAYDAIEKEATAKQTAASSSLKAKPIMDTDSEDAVASTAKTKASLKGDKKKSPVTYAAPTKTTAKSTATAKAPYIVVAASFSKIDLARKFMEGLVKQGYHDAEVTKFAGSQYWIVAADRVNTEAEAKKASEALRKVKDCEKAYFRKIH